MGQTAWDFFYFALLRIVLVAFYKKMKNVSREYDGWNMVEAQLCKLRGVHALSYLCFTIWCVDLGFSV